MAILLRQRQAVALFTAALVVTVGAHGSSDKDPIPAVGNSLAQGAVKFYGIAQPTEAAHFAGLDDIYDDQATEEDKATEVEAEAPSSFTLGYRALTGHSPSSHFASLDDIYDDKATDADAQVEVFDFSVVRRWLTSPSLYFTIALAIFAGLFLTSPSGPEETVQQQPKQPQVTKPCVDEPSAVVSAGQTDVASKADVPSIAEPEPSTATEKVAAEAKVSGVGGRVQLNALPLDACKAEEAEAPKPNALLAAADACRAGEAGSYANFCKLLAAQSSVQ